jgi:hypothetical protein
MVILPVHHGHAREVRGKFLGKHEAAETGPKDDHVREFRGRRSIHDR